MAHRQSMDAKTKPGLPPTILLARLALLNIVLDSPEQVCNLYGLNPGKSGWEDMGRGLDQVLPGLAHLMCIDLFCRLELANDHLDELDSIEALGN